MRGQISIAVIAFFGCSPASKPPASVEPSTLRRDAPTVRIPPANAPLAASSHTEAAPPAPSAPPPAPDPSSSTGERHPTPAEERACAARGGTIQPICMMGELACVIRYRDGGKRCTDKRDCTGECLYDGPDPPPSKATGTCERTSDPCGCKSIMHDGHAEPVLCAD